MSGLDIHLDEHAPGFPQHHFEHALSLEELHHLKTREAEEPRGGFAWAIVGTFVLGFVATGVIYCFA